MKKVLFITGNQSLTGGTERITASISNMLSKNGFIVEILSLKGKPTSHFYINEGIKLNSLILDDDSGIKFLVNSIINIKKYLQKNTYDSIVIVESIIFLLITPYLLLCKNRARIINWEHFNYDISLGLKTRRLSRWLAAKLADKIIVLTKSDMEKWIQNLNVRKNKIVQIYNLNPYSNNINKKIKDKIEDKIHPSIALAAGRLTNQKGFDLLIEAWSLIQPEIRKNWQLKIVGEGEDRDILENLVKSKNLCDSISLPGVTRKIEDEYKNASLFILSSRFEGFGLVLTEALSFGVPVISFDCPCGPSEIVIDNVNGYLVPPENILLLSEAIANYMKNIEKSITLKENTHIGLEKFTENEILPLWTGLINNQT